MKIRTLMLALTLCFIGAAACFAQDPNIGTWKLNEAKSHMPAEATKITTVVFAADGDNMKVTQEAIDKDGKPIHSEWTGKFDGKDYPVAGNPNSDTRSYTKIDARTLEFNAKKGGRVTVNGRVVVSADGKSRTVSSAGTDPEGKRFTSTAVYDK